MTDTSRSADHLLSVAFSLQSNPGAYALLLGAGVSAPSGIPTAWGVLENLVERLADASGTETDDVIEWYEGEFHEFPTYEGVLERIAPTQIERQRLLRDYFEQSPEDIDSGLKAPTAAHRSIARLVRSGAVKVIVTLNFDRLIERALRDEGIEPTVVASPADINGMAPLHTIDCCVVHLHGDYLNPTSMLNTASELRAYHPSTAKLLQFILENYGLVVAGWSSKYDPALREAIANHYPARFTLTWFEPGSVTDEAATLRTLKKGLLISADADNGFGRLADGVDALAARHARHPMTVPVLVETAKRELSGQTVAIRLHDALKGEFATLHRLPEFHLTDHQSGNDYEAMLARVEEATKTSSALVATVAYWGDEVTDRWWIGELPRFATPADGSGLVKLLSLRVVSGSALFYAAGVAAVSAQRFDLLNRLFGLRRFNRYNGEYEALAGDLDAESGYENAQNIHTRLFGIVAPLLSQALSIGPETLDDAWQLFEVLRMAWSIRQSSQFEALKQEYSEKDREFEEADTTFGTAEQRGADATTARSNRATACENRDRVLGRLGRLARVRRPHVLTADMRMDDRYQSVTALRLLSDITAEDAAHPLLTSGFADNPADLALAVRSVSARLGAIGYELSWQRARNSFGAVPSEIWLDSGMTPDELAASSVSPSGRDRLG